MEWISVKDRLPEPGDYSVLAAYSNGSVEQSHPCNVISMVHTEDWLLCNMHPFVTHWMPLPAPPEEET